MEQITLQGLRDLADNYELKFQDDYSGRGMYGKECIGVVGTWSDMYQFLLALGEDEDIRDLFALEGAPRSDNMGLDTVWYWPGLSADAFEEV
jgi:hypothetical protein